MLFRTEFALRTPHSALLRRLRGRAVCATTLAANNALMSATQQKLVIIVIFQLIAS
jgi:hypothetical protein